MRGKTREHIRPLPGIPGADLLVRLETERNELVAYAVVLRVFEQGQPRPVRLYDYVPAHGAHHLHRYTRTGAKQQPPEVLRHPTVQRGFDSAIDQIRASADEMIESWRRQSTRS
jgi:hypothetical protein